MINARKKVIDDLEIICNVLSRMDNIEIKFDNNVHLYYIQGIYHWSNGQQERKVLYVSKKSIEKLIFNGLLTFKGVSEDYKDKIAKMEEEKHNFFLGK